MQILLDSTLGISRWARKDSQPVNRGGASEARGSMWSSRPLCLTLWTLFRLQPSPHQTTHPLPGAPTHGGQALLGAPPYFWEGDRPPQCKKENQGEEEAELPHLVLPPTSSRCSCIVQMMQGCVRELRRRTAHSQIRGSQGNSSQLAVSFFVKENTQGPLKVSEQF